MRRLLIGLLLTLPALGMAADPKVEELLAQMRDAYKNVKTAKYTVKAKVQRQGQAISLNADLTFRSPNKVFGKITGFPEGTPMKELDVVSDGEHIAVIGAPTPTPKVPFSPDDLSIRFSFANLETLCFWDYAKQLSTAKGDNMEHSELKILADEDVSGRKFMVLEEKAEKQKVLVHYWIDPQTHLIWRTQTKNTETEAVINDSKLLTLDTDVKVDEKLFKIIDVAAR